MSIFHSIVYSDKEDNSKKGVFDRLELSKTASTYDLTDTSLTESSSSSSQDRLFRVTGIDRQTSSVFSRLGGKDDLEDTIIEHSRTFSGILKNTTTKLVSLFYNYLYNHSAIKCLIYIYRPHLVVS